MATCLQAFISIIASGIICLSVGLHVGGNEVGKGVGVARIFGWGGGSVQTDTTADPAL